MNTLEDYFNEHRRRGVYEHNVVLKHEPNLSAFSIAPSDGTADPMEFVVNDHHVIPDPSVFRRNR